MYLNAEYGESAPLQLVSAILLYGSEQKIRFATTHKPIRDPHGGPALLDAGEPLTRGFLEKLARGLGSELPSTFLPNNVLVYSTSLTAWWDPAETRSMFFSQDCDGKTLDGRLFPHPPLVFAVHNGHLMVWALSEEGRPTPDSWLYMAPYWNTYEDGRVCHGTMQTPQVVTVENLPQWSHAFFSSRFTGSNLGIQQCGHPQGFLGMWSSLIGEKKFPTQYLIRKRKLGATVCRNL